MVYHKSTAQESRETSASEKETTLIIGCDLRVVGVSSPILEAQEEIQVQRANKRIVLDADTITRRVKEMGAEISARHPEGNLILIGILKGSFIFLADLVRSITVPLQVDFARIASYGNGTVSCGDLNIILDVDISLEGRDVILVDDIIDTGLTLSEYRKNLMDRGPRSLEIAAFIDKTGRREKHVALDYCGFQVEGGFLVGYGLDRAEQDRQHDCLYALE
jgi:hypoxanthine phosphoribosyltransferase